MIKYHYAQPDITEADLDNVLAALRQEIVSRGPSVLSFEQAFADFVGCEHAVSCNNGTAALHLAYLAADLGPARGLLTSPVTFLATANAAQMVNAPVVFADVDPTTGNMDPQSVEHSLQHTDRQVAAIAPVHLAGRPCDMPRLHDLARAHDCLIIEDACHAPGARYRDAQGNAHRVGACRHSDMAVFSFQATKHITMGEGGVVCTNSAELAARMRTLRNHGMSRDPATWQHPPETDAPWYYEMQNVGFNYWATDFQCALALSQLSRLDESLRIRRDLAQAYDEELGNLAYLRPPRQPDEVRGHAWHLYPIAIDFASVGQNRGQVMRTLAEQGIGTQVHYIPLYRQPYYAAQGHSHLPGAEAYYHSTLSIPLHTRLTRQDVAHISATIRDTLR